MARTIAADICVIGAGSGGLSVAAGAAMLGLKTVLVEKGAMGGECLNTGCVPSKALLAAAEKAESQRSSAAFGIASVEPVIDFPAVMAHVRAVIAAIAPIDSAERFEGLGVKVIRAQARFKDRRRIEAGGQIIRARRFVIATGSRPLVPPIEGLAGVPYFTNETLFDNNVLPAHLLVIGGGPVGVEMAQAFRRLGAKVTLFEMDKILPREDPELTALLRAALEREGVVIRQGMRIVRAAPSASGVSLTLQAAAGTEIVEGSHLLLATGRAPNVEDLGLAEAGVEYSATGIKVDARLRTTNKHVFALGDVLPGPRFTHAAGFQAGIVIRNALFKLPARAEGAIMPAVTYTDPELASVGLSEAEAEKAYPRHVRIIRERFVENDRARAERRTEGMIKLVLHRSGRVLGIGILGQHAGDLLQVWILAMNKKLRLSDLATMVVPYPTVGEVNKRAAGGFYRDTLFSARTRLLVGALKWLP